MTNRYFLFNDEWQIIFNLVSKATKYLKGNRFLVVFADAEQQEIEVKTDDLRTALTANPDEDAITLNGTVSIPRDIADEALDAVDDL